MVRGPLPPVAKPGEGREGRKKPPRGRIIISPIERPGYKPPKGKPGWKTIQPVPKPPVTKKPRPIGRRTGRA